METILKVGGIYSVKTAAALNQVSYRIVVVIINNTPITADTVFLIFTKSKCQIKI